MLVTHSTFIHDTQFLQLIEVRKDYVAMEYIDGTVHLIPRQTMEQFAFEYLVIGGLPYNGAIIQFLIMNAFADESQKYNFSVVAKMACPTTYEENKVIRDKIDYIKSHKASVFLEPYISAYAHIDGGKLDQPVQILYENRQDLFKLLMHDANFRSEFYFCCRTS
jgi:hypothetical protein